jgi:hypothetical protein
MKTRIFLHLILLALLLVACTPVAARTDLPVAATEAPSLVPATATLAAPAVEKATQPAPAQETALPVATSRGPELHATDPATVSLASGGLQFVEFFRFT